MDVNITALSSTNTTLGWQPGCNTRGTWDIIWNCTQTIALCAWISVCANIPAPEHGSWDLYTDKFFFTLLTLLGPEFVFLLAFGQYHSAASSKKLFHELGHLDWSLTHGFYADMGGIHVQPSGWKRFPVNAKQLHYLVKRGYMEYPTLMKSDIDAQGKVEGLARLITVTQALSFLVTTIARFATGLAVTTLEITVLANIFCTLATFVVWWQKPTDVETCHLFQLQTTIETIIKEAGEDANGQYKDTPLDFVSRDEWSGSLLWNYYVNILRRLNLLKVFNLHYGKPAQRINTFNFPKPGSRPQLLFLLWITMAYCAFFLGAWDFHFPTTIERTLWRATVIAQSVIAFIGAGFEIAVFKAPVTHLPPLHRRDSQVGVHTVPKSEKLGIASLRHLWDMPCNNELTGNYPCLDVPFRSILITTPCCAAYVICRWYILVEDIITLRSLPASAFQQVDWTPYWPWF